MKGRVLIWVVMVVARFTPWQNGGPLHADQEGPLIYEVLRPGLQLAFPLEPQEHDNDRRFAELLEALARRFGHPVAT